MKVRYPDSERTLYKIMKEAREDSAHCVVPAWVTENSPLHDVLINVFGYPSPDGRPFGVDGLAGHAWTQHRTDTSIDHNWHNVWRLCDAVNDNYETGTLLPHCRLTLLPAYTITQPLKPELVRTSIKDIFEAHDRFSIDAPVYVFSSMSQKSPDGAHELLRQHLEEIKTPEVVFVNHIPGREVRA